MRGEQSEGGGGRKKSFAHGGKVVYLKRLNATNYLLRRHFFLSFFPRAF